MESLHAIVATGVVELVVVGFAALATSILSSVAGLGGGVVLLAVLAQFHRTGDPAPGNCGVLSGSQHRSTPDLLSRKPHCR